MTRRFIIPVLAARGLVIALPGCDPLPASASTPAELIVRGWICSLASTFLPAFPAHSTFTTTLTLESIMKLFQHIIAVAAIISVSACSTVMTVPQSGYLSDYSALAETPDTVHPHDGP